jgi:Dehydrogenases with different specificities (related to short-chain alcohol dehydrogenases)
MARKDQVCLVTGGAAGIGAAISHRLGSEGCEVVIADINEDKGKWRERNLRELGVMVTFIRTDVSSEEDVKNLMEWVGKRYGKLDVLVNNAGVGFHGKPLEEQSLDEWRRVIETNLTGPWLTTKYALPYLKGGVVVNIASTRAFQSEPDTEPYSASKGGVVALTHSMAVSLAKYGIRVISISPGWIDTSKWQVPPREPSLSPLDNQQHLTGRVGRPEDVASLVSFLTSDDASWISGVNFVIDGGMTVRMLYMDEGVLGWASSILTEDEEVGTLLRDSLSKAWRDQEAKKRLIKALRELNRA